MKYMYYAQIRRRQRPRPDTECYLLFSLSFMLNVIHFFYGFILYNIFKVLSEMRTCVSFLFYLNLLC